MTRWEHAADYPEDSLGYQMYRFEQIARCLSEQGDPSMLAKLDQLSARYDDHLHRALTTALDDTEGPT